MGRYRGGLRGYVLVEVSEVAGVSPGEAASAGGRGRGPAGAAASAGSSERRQMGHVACSCSHGEMHFE